jgi:hypothetical protein
MRQWPFFPAQEPAVEIVHHLVSRHQVEVEIFPARATLYFQDERNIDPVDTLIRFEAVVYNSDSGVTWQALAPDGSPGAGSIDATGLYRAPNKNGLPSGTTDVVVATARADPLRKASAWVTVVGRGPAPAPIPRIEIWPKQRGLYYRAGADNAYIDDSNKMQLFQAFLSHSPGPQVAWLVDGVVQGGTDPWFLYRAPANGAGALVTVTARIQALPAVQDEAKVIVRNYNWPGL